MTGRKGWSGVDAMTTQLADDLRIVSEAAAAGLLAMPLTPAELADVVPELQIRDALERAIMVEVGTALNPVTISDRPPGELLFRGLSLVVGPERSGALPAPARPLSAARRDRYAALSSLPAYDAPPLAVMAADGNPLRHETFDAARRAWASVPPPPAGWSGTVAVRYEDGEPVETMTDSSRTWKPPSRDVAVDDLEAMVRELRDGDADNGMGGRLELRQIPAVRRVIEQLERIRDGRR